MDHAFGILSKNLCLAQVTKIFFPIFSARNLRVLGFIFRPKIHFELFFVYFGLSNSCNFITLITNDVE